MVKESITVEITLGLHARPILHLVNALKTLDVKVTAYCEDRKANLNSVMEAMLMAVPCGKILEVEADGPDEEKAVEAIKKVLAEKDL